jgi:hypothetical protein
MHGITPRTWKAAFLGLLLVFSLVPRELLHHHAEHGSEAMAAQHGDDAAVFHEECDLCDMVLPLAQVVPQHAVPALARVAPPVPAPHQVHVVPVVPVEHAGRGPPTTA